MKKLMTIVAAVVAGLSVSAASVDWELDAYDLVSGGADPTPYTLYVFADGTSASTLAAALNTSGKFNESAYNTALSGATKVTGSFDAYGWASDSISGVDSAISFLVLTDGTTADSQFYYSGSIDVAGSTYVPPSGSPGAVYTDFSTLSSGTVGQAGAVPEPTSGLLLLVGAGMLALRRKQK